MTESTIVTEDAAETTTASLPPEPEDLAADTVRHNFWTLACYQIVVRTGWIFKTESIIMPAVIDLLGGPSWVRGCLPMLSRFGQSIPPLVVASSVAATPYKSRGLSLTTTAMGLAFLVLATIWHFRADVSVTTAIVMFLVCYTFFFSCVGINQIYLGTLQGKLIPVRQRGRLLMTAHVCGAATAIAAVALVLPWWLHEDGGAFDAVFGIAGALFVVGAMIGSRLQEAPDPPTSIAMPQQVARGTAVFDALLPQPKMRRLLVVAMLFGTSLTLFPHYQALGRHALGLDYRDLTTWVIVQNVGTAIISMVLGPLADHRGNRIALRCLLFGLGLLPLIALAIAAIPARGESLFPVVFMMLGMTPVTLKTLQNYTLEISTRGEHARCLATLGVALAIPIALSPLVGVGVDRFGFAPVFVAVGGAVGCGWVGTFFLAEPREGVST